MERLGRFVGWSDGIQLLNGFMADFVVANGKAIPTIFPSTLEQFLIRQNLLPRSVVVEHNGEAVAPSQFPHRELAPGDRLEIVKIVAGG